MNTAQSIAIDAVIGQMATDFPEFKFVKKTGNTAIFQNGGYRVLADAQSLAALLPCDEKGLRAAKSLIQRSWTFRLSDDELMGSFRDYGRLFG